MSGIVEAAGWSIIAMGFAFVMTGIVLLFPVAVLPVEIHMSILLGGVLLCRVGRWMVES